ncbi:MAG: hypothetical protein Q7R66_02230 [Undibacterium sp.]|uniref:hypothetical protein n=1 Tax=Undibacterium sp. TaxID=1914977 RepID=UPI002721170F|nr:hypothetical protein [Undibacterium sp.]MDO8650989.1 hypothetical protein [Undibacterium sp.]
MPISPSHAIHAPSSTDRLNPPGDCVLNLIKPKHCKVCVHGFNFSAARQATLLSLPYKIKQNTAKIQNHPYLRLAS